VAKVTITSSGGALRDWSDERAFGATVEDALNHPTWEMGAKITIDSATLMNKTLELIEAHWLFDLPPEQLGVLIHPESIIHAMVEFRDGSVVAQLARPDMTLPIAFALGHPDRPGRTVAPLDLQTLGSLTFRPLPARARRAVELAWRVIRRGGASGAVLNGANEQAVWAFREGRISFGQIVPLVELILNRWDGPSEVNLQTFLAADAWARDQVERALARGSESLPVGPDGRE
jgi:1-deoxy-D-xylulose-5-phosphate reductoisomerase